MKGKRFTDEQIAYALLRRRAERRWRACADSSARARRAFICGRSKYPKLGLTEIPELRQLRDENTRLKRLAADLTLDKHILGEVVRKRL